MMEFYRKGHIRPVRLDRIFSGSTTPKAFQHMQQGNHVGKLVVTTRNPSSQPELGGISKYQKKSPSLDAGASYLLVGGLGGLGRTVFYWMIEHGARNLIFLSRSAGSNPRDKDFIRDLESLGCTVQLVRGNVNTAEDVKIAMTGSVAPLKGIIQMSMILRDQSFLKMSFDDWNITVEPKIRGTWNLHNTAVGKGMDLDFFVLFSSLSGVVGQPGQANYAAANTFLDAFVQYRASMGLACTSIDIGAMEGTGYLFENKDLLRKMQGAGWRVVVEEELLEALGHAMLPPSARNNAKRAAPASEQHSQETFINANTVLLGIAPTIPLSSPNSALHLRRDVRMAVYHNIGHHELDSSSDGSNSNSLRIFLTSAKANPAVYRTKEAAETLAKEIGWKLFSLLLKSEQEPDVTLGLAELGLDSMIGVEVRAWLKMMFGLDISVLDMLSMGTLIALGTRLANQLADIYRE